MASVSVPVSGAFCEIGRRYHSALATGVQIMPVGDAPGVPAHPTMLRPCTYVKCNEKEKAGERRFAHCKRCYSVYCSSKCQKNDHSSGTHKDVCKRFQHKVEASKKFYAEQKCESCAANYLRTGFSACDSCQSAIDQSEWGRQVIANGNDESLDSRSVFTDA